MATTTTTMPTTTTTITSSSTTNNVVAPPKPQPCKRQRRLPTQVSAKKMVLGYKEGVKDFHGFKLYYLNKPIVMKFNHLARIFKCANNQRIGVTNIDASDKAVLLNHLRNVAGSLPVTVKHARKVFDDKREEETLFVNMNQLMVFDHKGHNMDGVLPMYSDSKLAIVISGMKVKDEEASYMIRAHQVMLTKDFDVVKMMAPPSKPLFEVSEDSDDSADIENFSCRRAWTCCMREYILYWNWTPLVLLLNDKRFAYFKYNKVI